MGTSSGSAVDSSARLNHPNQFATSSSPRTWKLANPAPPAAHGEEGTEEDHALERLVDIHAFVPSDLVSHAQHAGFTDVRVRGEELVANWFGWFNRTLEATADPADVPMLWRKYAFHGYLALQRVDVRALEPVLPPALFYNLLLTARKPG